MSARHLPVVRRRSADDVLGRDLEGAAGAEPTARARALLQGALPADGFERARRLGVDAGAFDRARRALRTFEPQRAISTVRASGPVADVGVDVVARLRLGPLEVLAIDRVVDVVDEDGRYGFAYVTLPGHALRGEEAFLVERTAEGEVVARVRGWADVAVPGGRLLRWPLRLAEGWAAERYLDAIARAVRR